MSGSLYKLSNKKFPRILDTSSGDLIRDFFEPALAFSIKYDRGVGFFSSGWLREAAKGMATFAKNSGRARWVTSPILGKDDWEALRRGEEARFDEELRRIIEINLNELEQKLEQETLSALAWLVADGILDFRLALPRNKLEYGEFHDKFGIFTDSEGNQVSFNGSYNDSIQGIRNYESIKIFCSWEPNFVDLVCADAERFEKLWNNMDPNVQVFELPEAAWTRIVRLHNYDRPYPEPDWDKLHLLREGHNHCEVYGLPHPQIPPRIILRDYQIQAIDAWFAHGCQGLLEMATGTGKTITALAASTRLYERERQLAVIITVPYQHLVDQWNEEAKGFGYRSVLAYQSKVRWLNELNHQIIEFSNGYRRFISVITTHATFNSPEFQTSVSRLTNPVLLIADEAHHLGAEVSRQSYPQNVPFRLALSATPDRWFDDVGTVALRDYFGETVFRFPLDKAIGISLTPYYYHPHLVSLTEEELEHYEELTVKIAMIVGHEDQKAQDALKLLLIKRAELLNKADNKLSVLSRLIDKEDRIEHTLFYCAPGQIENVLHLLGWEKGLLIHRFTAEENPQERQRLLTDFALGKLQSLVAMKCLDEGVDVPSTRTAFILASSSNPREFIQRRGRILRKAPGKEFSIIHDLITVPPMNWTTLLNSPTFEVERSIMRRELNRFKEFASLALNKHQALDIVWDIARRYSLMDF